MQVAESAWRVTRMGSRKLEETKATRCRCHLKLIARRIQRSAVICEKGLPNGTPLLVRVVAKMKDKWDESRELPHRTRDHGQPWEKKAHRVTRGGCSPPKAIAQRA